MNIVTINDLENIINTNLGITKQCFSLNYQDLFNTVKSTLTDKGYDFDAGNKLIQEKNDTFFYQIFSYIASVVTEVTCDSTIKAPALRDVNYMGHHLDELQKLISMMTAVQLQPECEKALEVIKSRFPIQESDSTQLVMYMLIFYDLGFNLHAAGIAYILYTGIYKDIPATV